MFVWQQQIKQSGFIKRQNYDVGKNILLNRMHDIKFTFCTSYTKLHPVAIDNMLRRLHRSKKNHRKIIVIGQIIGSGQIDSFMCIESIIKLIQYPNFRIESMLFNYRFESDGPIKTSNQKFFRSISRNFSKICL